MRILIVNDDGIDSAGLKHLALWARTKGEVTVAAPKYEQSGKSHAINFITPFEVKAVELGEGIKAYSVDSTPADCTRFGIIGLGVQYDLVLSGINKGINMSGDIVYSGTVGAIFEAEHSNHRAVALSIAKEDALPEFSVLDEIFDFIFKNDLFADSALYNVNIPSSPRGILITRQGDAYFSDEFFHLEGDMYIQRGHSVPETTPNDLSLDTVAFREGYISVTPMTLSRTSAEAYARLTERIQKEI